MDHPIKVVPAEDTALAGARPREPESQPALSQEIDTLFQYFVERAHEAVDRLAERAAPALGQFAETFVHGAEPSEPRGDPEHAVPPGTASRRAQVRSSGSAAAYLGVVRQHPVAALALAVAAGIVIRQIRTR